MDVRACRERVGVSQRVLAERTGISQATLSRIEGGERVASPGEVGLIDVALAETGLAPRVEPPESQARGGNVEPREVRRGRRRAFVCRRPDCCRRVFLTPGELDRVPDCGEHGLMARQANRPYMGLAT